jgi:hypothetical protein
MITVSPQFVAQQIAYLVPTLEGWSTAGKNIEFANIILEDQPTVALEIGVFGGRTLLSIALAMKAVGHGVCVGIDPWSPAESVKGMDDVNRDWWGKLDHEKIYQGCVQAVETWNLKDHVSIIRARSDDVTPDYEIGLLIVDGNHGPQSIRDVARYVPFVPVGGWVYLDDLDWTGGAVRQAEQDLLRMGFDFVRRSDEGAFYKRREKPTS